MFPTGPTSAPMGLSARGSSLRILPRGYLARGRLAFSFQSSAAPLRATLHSTHGLTRAAQMLTGLGDTLTHHPLLALVTLLGAGLATSLTPCIYPIIPITAGILSGTSAGQPSRARALRLTLTYASGLALFYAVLGLVAGLSGSLFGTVSASPWARFAIGNLLLVFGLAMLDVFPLSAPR